MKNEFERQANARGVSLELVEVFYNQTHPQNSPEERLESAVSQAVRAENVLIGKNYARAFLRNDIGLQFYEPTVESWREKIMGLPEDRHSHIFFVTNDSFLRECDAVRLPQPALFFDDAMIRTSLSYEDKKSFHELYTKREPHIAEFFNQRSQLPEPVRPSWLPEPTDPSYFARVEKLTLPESIQFRQFEKLQNDYNDKLIALNRKLENKAKEWEFENGQYDFPSIVDPKEREIYDSLRRAAQRNYSQPPGYSL